MSCAVRFGYVDTPAGQMHFAECGAGPAIVLLHQTPRSWDEYRELLPLLGVSRRAIAVDTIGFGASARTIEHSIETYAAAVLGFIDALGLTRVVLVGHHTGGVVALEVAARAPGRVEKLVLSSTPYVDAAARERRRAHGPVDGVEPDIDGGFLIRLWQRRRRYCPDARPELLARLMHDALALELDDVDKGHDAVGRYVMEDRVTAVQCPVLCIGATADPYAFPDLSRLDAALLDSRIAVVNEATVAMMERHAEQVAELIGGFVA